LRLIEAALGRGNETVMEYRGTLAAMAFVRVTGTLTACEHDRLRELLGREELEPEEREETNRLFEVAVERAGPEALAPFASVGEVLEMLYSPGPKMRVPASQARWPWPVG
jgi:hypothetical protein